jgi:hypothetical protein
LEAYFRWIGIGSPFFGCRRIEQIRAPLDLNIVVPGQLIDPNLADIAEGSDVVGEDDHWYRLTGADFHRKVPFG